MKKRILSLGLVLIMILSMAQFTVSADTVTADGKYQIIDMSAAANGTVYAVPVLDPEKTGNAQLVDVIPNFTTDYHAPKYPNVQYSTSANAPAYLLNKTIMDSKKDASGYIYADDGVPFSFRTEMDTDDTINLGGIATGIIQKAELPVSGNFTSIDVVVASTAKVSSSYGTGATAETVKANTLKNDIDFKATVYYTDGTVVTDPDFHGMFLGWGDTGANVKLDLANVAEGYAQPKSQISAFTTALNQGLRIKNLSSVANWEKYWCTQIPTYSIVTDPAKTVEKVVFEHGARCMVSILAMTGVKASDDEVVAAALATLPDVSAITAENYAQYVATVATIESKVAAGASISTSNLAKVNAVKDVINYYANKYQIIDMSAAANGTVYAVPVLDPNKTGSEQLKDVIPNFTTDYHAPKYPNINYSTSPSAPAYLLNKTTMDSKKDASGYIYADDGVPFSFRTEMDTDDTINLGGIATGRIQKAELPVSGNFTSIDVVVASTAKVSSSYGTGATAETVKANTLKNDIDFKATVYYTDGTVVTDPDFHGMFLGWGDTGAGVKLDLANVAEGYTQPKSQISAFTTALNQGLCIKNVSSVANWEKYWCTQIPTYSIETIPSKTVEKVVFEHKERCVVSILAMTATKATPEQAFEGKFENIPDASTITEANYKTYLSLYNGINSGIVAGYAIPEGYADAYEAFAEEMEYYINKYTVIDFSKVADANGTMYGTPNEDGSFPSFNDCEAPEYLGIGYTGSGTPSVVLNKTAFDSFKDAEGLIYADDGVPFLFRTENDKKNALNLGGYGTGKKTQIEVPVNGNFTSIDLVALSTGTISGYGGGTPIPAYNDDTQLVAEIHYEGGEVVVSDFHGKLLGWKDTSTALDLENVAEGFTQPKSQFSQFLPLRSGGLRIKSTVADYYDGNPGVEQYWGTAVPTYSIATDPAKTVEKIVFKHDLRCMVSILAMTAVNDPRSVVETEPAAAPTVSVEAGRVAKGTTVALECATEGATIYYTTNGDDPTTDSAVYEAPIEITADMTIKAIAGGEGFETSAITTAAYDMYLYGDVNDDGAVDISDRLELTRKVVGWEGYDYLKEDASDVNADGVVDANDRLILTRFIVGWEDYKTLPWSE